MTDRTRSRIPWQTILLEAFFVVFGVVAALGANEWREARADARRAETALASIREELHANRRSVRAAVDYHLHLTDTLRTFRQAAVRAGAGAVPSAALFARGFVHPATLFETAWTTAGATDAISHMPYADVLALARIYEAQRTYDQQSIQIGQLIYTRLFTEGFESMVRNYANLTAVLTAVWYRECQLLKQYDDVLASLGDTPRDTTALPPTCTHVPAYDEPADAPQGTAVRDTAAPAGRTRPAAAGSTGR